MVLLSFARQSRITLFRFKSPLQSLSEHSISMDPQWGNWGLPTGPGTSIGSISGPLPSVAPVPCVCVCVGLGLLKSHLYHLLNSNASLFIGLKRHTRWLLGEKSHSSKKARGNTHSHCSYERFKTYTAHFKHTAVHTDTDTHKDITGACVTRTNDTCSQTGLIAADKSEDQTLIWILDILTKHTWPWLCDYTDRTDTVCVIMFCLQTE